MLRRLGDLSLDELEQRTAEGFSAESMLGKLERERRAVPVRIAGEERWIAAEDAGLYRDALGVPPPGGLPESFLEPVHDAMATVVRRYARTHGPFPTAQIARRYGIDLTPALRELERAGELVRGELLPGGSEREWCDADVLRRVRRASVAALRQEVEAVDPAELARFLPAWQNVDVHRPAGAGPDRLREALVPLQGVALTPEVWERDVLPRRLGAYSPTWLDQLTTSGELVWIGAGPLGRTGKVALYFREDVRLCGPPPSNAKLDLPRGARSTTRSASGSRAAPSFWLDLVAELEFDREEIHSALWDLVWAGEVTNDAFAPLRARRLTAVASQRRRSRRFASRHRPAQEAIVGRWSLTETLFRDAPAEGPRLRAQAELMLERYGIVTRETVLAEGVPGGFSSLYGELSNLEMLGTARRGYFVEGLGGAQFALAGAVERLRSLPACRGRVPAARAPPTRRSPTAPRCHGPSATGGRRPARTPGAYVLLRDGNPILYVERGGKSIVRLVELEGEELVEAVSQLSAAARDQLIRKLGIERVDGEPVFGSGLEDAIIAAGFSRQPRRLVAA